MRYVLSIIAILGLSAPVFAGHAAGIPPGQATKGDAGLDRNGDGNKNGKDYAPGQSAQEDAAADNNGDGAINGKDYAPGQIRHDD